MRAGFHFQSISVYFVEVCDIAGIRTFLSYNFSNFLRFLPITFSPLILGSQQDGEYNHHFINDETREQREREGETITSELALCPTL